MANLVRITVNYTRRIHAYVNPDSVAFVEEQSAAFSKIHFIGGSTLEVSEKDLTAKLQGIYKEDTRPGGLF